MKAFRDHGAKTIIWHGWADELVTADSSIHYYKRVQAQMGGAKKTAEFARLYLAPGVGHCHGGPGPQPTGVLDALVAWVEHGKAPETLLATHRDRTTGAVIRSRPLCQYPLVARTKDRAARTRPGTSCVVLAFNRCRLRALLWAADQSTRRADLAQRHGVHAARRIRNRLRLSLLTSLSWKWLAALDDFRNWLIREAA